MNRWKRLLAMLLAISLVTSSCVGFAESDIAAEVQNAAEVLIVPEESAAPEETAAPEQTAAPEETPAPEATQMPVCIVLSESAADMQAGDTLQLGVTLNECAGECEILWSSSDENVATVSDGTVTALGAGEAVITAACGDASAQCVVTVRPRLTALTLNLTESTLLTGETLALTAVPNEGAQAEGIVWSSSNENVATVTDGTVTAVGVGEATITAACGEITAQCVVTVHAPLTGIRLDITAADLLVGETLQLTVSPNKGAQLGDVVWSTSDAAVATVTDGLVTAAAPGNAVITATCGEFTAVCGVNVSAPLTALTIQPEQAVMSVGSTLQLTVTPNAGAQLPAAMCNEAEALICALEDMGKDADVRWSSSNTGVATVAGGLVTAVAPGTAVITVACGDISAQCRIEVRIPLEIGDHEGMVYTKENMALDYIYNMADVEAVSSAVWSVNNPAIATIDAATGVLTGVSKGTVRVTVTVTGANGSVYAASTDVAVKVRLGGISLSTMDLHLAPGQTAALTATLLPSGAEGTVQWTATDERIATVSSAGVVTAVGVGTTTVTATCGTFMAVCTVVVAVPVTGVQLLTDIMMLQPAQKGAIRYQVLPANATDKTISWISGDNSIATVDDDGVVTALRAGECTITGVTSSDITFSVPVKVVGMGQAVTSIKLNATSRSLVRTQTFQLKATVGPKGAADKSVTWASQNPGVATVDANGKVTAVGVGTTTVLAVSSSGLYKTCRITVTPLKVSSVKLNATAKTLYNGQTLQLNATLTPANADDLSVKWSSSNSSVARVDENGLVTAGKSGTAYIYCKAASGKSARCKVTVKSITPVMNVTKVSIAAEETYQVSVMYNPQGIDQPALTWYSGKTSVATVDANGRITAVGQGTAKVYCKTAYGASDFVTVTVKAPSPVMDVTKKTIASGDSFAIHVTSNPQTNRDLGLTWSTSRASVATVDANGVVTGQGKGTAKITVRTKYGTTDTMTVTVKAVTPVMNVTKLNLAADQTYQVHVSYNPATAQDMGLTWYSSKDSVAAVDANGLITATGKGTAKVYCKTRYGATDYVTVTVKAPVPVMSVTKATVYAGMDYQIRINGYSPATDRPIRLEWYSSNPSVAAVNADGVVTGVKSGKAKIYCKTQYGTTDYATITVKASTPVLQGTAYTLDVGDTLTVPVTFAPNAAAAPEIRWYTDDTRVAAVNEDGLITAIGPGATTITVMTADRKKDTVKITVSPLKVASVTLNHPYGDLAVGGQYIITADVQPANAGNKALNWTTGDPAVATVDASGTVTALAAGTTTITAAAKDGSGVSGSIDIVVKAVSVTSFALDVESVQVAAGQTHQVNMTLDAQLDTVVPYWSSDNPRVAAVDETGLITGVGSGITMVRCRIGGEVRSVKVIVPVVNGSYRVLIAGQYTNANVSGYLNFAENGLQGVENVFDLANVYGDRYETLRLNNPKKDALLNGIDSFFADTTENDISVLYLMSHGLNVGGEYRWMISGTNGGKYSDDDYVTEAELTGRISQINGKVLVVVVSCYSGQYLNNFCTEQAAASLSGAVSNINGSRPDSEGINIITSQVGNINSPYTDFPTEASYDFFNIVFNMALGWDQLNGASLDHLPADANGDGVVSMQELAEYLAQNLPLVLQQHLGQYGSQSVLNTPQQNVNYYLTTPNQTFYARAKARLMAKLGRDGK